MEQESLLSDVQFNPVFASTGKRFVNYLIDIIIFDIIVRTIESIFAIGISAYGISDYYTALVVAIFIAYMFFIVLYFLSELIFKGRTIGKFITGTKAVNEDGSEMEPKIILIRSLCRFVPFEPFSAFGTPSRPWHDKWTHTIVIDVKQTALNNTSQF